MSIWHKPLVTLTLIVSVANPAPANAHGTIEEAAAATDPHAMHRRQMANDDADPHAKHRQQAVVSTKTGAAEIELPTGLSLVNRLGERVDLRDEVIGDRVAVVNFVYTSCTTVCPVTSSIFSMLQTRLEKELGREVALLTITVDPTRDTSHRMKSFAKNFNPRQGWSWLTGDKAAVDEALKAFGAYTPSFEDHPAMVLVGDLQSHNWIRLYGFPAPEAIEAQVRMLLKARTG